jgi:hypothetical protein
MKDDRASWASTARTRAPRPEAALDTQEFVNLADDLLVASTNFNEFLCSPGLYCDDDMRGWLYFHFRLDGVSMKSLRVACRPSPAG